MISFNTNEKKKVIVFNFNTNDEYIKRAFIRRGWVENSIFNSSFFDIKWNLNEHPVYFI